jgi:hypothetical protein
LFSAFLATSGCFCLARKQIALFALTGMNPKLQIPQWHEMSRKTQKVLPLWQQNSYDTSGMY